MLLKNVDANGDVAHELAGFISTEVDRTNALVTRFLDFARPLALRREKTDIAEVIDEAVRKWKSILRLSSEYLQELLARHRAVSRSIASSWNAFCTICS